MREDKYEISKEVVKREEWRAWGRYGIVTMFVSHGDLRKIGQVLNVEGCCYSLDYVQKEEIRRSS